MIRIRCQRRRGLKQNGSVRGEKAQTYVDISRLLDEAMGHFDQIPSGRPNGFQLGPKGPWKGNQPSRRAFRPDLFAIWAPRRRWHRIRILTMAGDLFGGDAPDQRDSGANGPAPLAERLRSEGRRVGEEGVSTCRIR